jgi:hypothetical protein
MGFPEIVNRARQEFERQRQRLAAGYAHRAAPQALEVLNLRFHALDFAMLLSQVVDEDFASGAQPDAARQALEQLRAEFRLEVGDSPVDRRRRDVEVFGDPVALGLGPWLCNAGAFRSRHPQGAEQAGFDCGQANFAVALQRVAVADRQKSAPIENRQMQRSTGAEILVVDIAAPVAAASSSPHDIVTVRRRRSMAIWLRRSCVKSSGSAPLPGRITFQPQSCASCIVIISTVSSSPGSAPGTAIGPVMM